jgi:glyoxylase-like metal-dependent hydrolase (beta-lactamase superfamily II)
MNEIVWERIVVGQMSTNCYIISHRQNGSGWIVDPGDEGVEISQMIYQKGIKPLGILLTHGHFDHSLGALDLKLIFGIPIYGSTKDGFLLKRQSQTANYFLGRPLGYPTIKVDQDLCLIDQISWLNENIRVIPCPGHTPGGVSFYLPSASIVFTGDTLFAGARGRTDLSYSDIKDLETSLDRLFKLPKDTIVLPGHGEETTVGKEKQNDNEGLGKDDRIDV